MGGHQIGNQILLFPKSFIHAFVSPAESLIDAAGRLSHAGKDRVRHMLWGDFQLAAYMMFTQLLYKFIGPGICKHIIKTDAGTDKDLFHARKGTELSKKTNILSMIRFQVRAGPRKQALPLRTGSAPQLLLTGRMAEIRGRTSHIMDIALEIRLLNHLPRFFHKRLLAARLDDPPLMEGQSAE